MYSTHALRCVHGLFVIDHSRANTAGSESTSYCLLYWCNLTQSGRAGRVLQHPRTGGMCHIRQGVSMIRVGNCAQSTVGISFSVTCLNKRR